jgi:5-formyltetrahydrofolate cyclo-ligase
VYRAGVSPTADKTELRARMRARRRTLVRAAPQAAQDAARRAPLDRLPAFAVVAGYHALGSELDPAPLLDRLALGGARVALPLGLAADGPLSFRAWTPGDPVAPDAFGVPSPLPQADLLTPDLVIAPVLAFDRRGGRLGQGGGTYDRTLANLRAGGDVFVLGLAYAGQEIDQVPGEAHDQRLDAILTEVEFIEAGAWASL